RIDRLRLAANRSESRHRLAGEFIPSRGNESPALLDEITRQMPTVSPSRTARERDAEIARVLDILHRWGIHTLGQFAALNKDEVGARLGAIGLQLWDRAKGKTTRLLKLVSPPESFEEVFGVENEIETVEPLLFMLRRFLQQLS